MTHTLLLADDSITIQRVIELTFADQDVRVVAVGDGEAAVAALESSHPDIVLADLEMPGRSGYDVARYIKNTPRLSDIPVLLLSGAFEPVDEAQVADAGCEGVLAKPFDPHLLIARVRELLQRHEPAAVPEPAPALTPASVTPSQTAAPGPDAVALTDEYLEQLDAALAERARSGWRPPAAIEPEPPAAEPMAPPPAVSISPPARTPEPPVAPASPPPLADAFAALLAAEQNVPAAAHAAPPQHLDDQVDAAVRRMFEQASERVVRDMAHEILTRVAERLVREEIRRIRDETP